MNADGYADGEDLADWLEAVADDAGLMAGRTENINDRHPLATWALGVEFGLRYAAYEARTVEGVRGRPTAGFLRNADEGMLVREMERRGYDVPPRDVGESPEVDA